MSKCGGGQTKTKDMFLGYLIKEAQEYEICG